MIRASAPPTRMPDVRELFRRYWRFPLVSVASSFVDVLASAVPIPLIGQLYGLEAAGYYVLVLTVLSAPASVVASSVADVFHGQLSEVKHTGGTEGSRLLFLRTARALALTATAISLPVAIAAPVIFPFVFGARWETAGTLAVVMSARLFAQLVVSPLSRVVYVYEGQTSKLLFDGAILITTVGSLSVAHLLGFTLVGAVAALAVTDLAVYGLYALVLWNLVRSGREEPSA